MFQTRKALDRLVPTAQGVKSFRQTANHLEPSREQTLGFKFEIGEIVKDLVTGKEVKVIAAERGDYFTERQSPETPE